MSDGPTFIPEDVAAGEWDTWPRVPTQDERAKMRAQQQSTTTSSPLTDPLSLLTTTDESLSFVVRAALDDLLLNVINQLQHDLNHGPAQTRSKIASQFLPRIMRALDKEEDNSDKELERLREEMERLNQEMLYGEPKLYVASSQTPDSDDLPIVDPQTGRTITPEQKAV